MSWTTTRRLVVALAFGLFAYAAPSMGAPKPHVAAPAHFRNPHLHGANDPVAEKDAHRFVDEHHGFVDRPHWFDHRHYYWFYIHHHWYHRWGYYGWTYLHRGLATIHGTVVGADGQPIAGASVRLRGANNGILSVSAKHLTDTGSGGNFTMVAVRAGQYRVRAEVGKASASTPLHIHPGEVASVSVRM